MAQNLNAILLAIFIQLFDGRTHWMSSRMLCRHKVKMNKKIAKMKSGK